MTGGQLTPREAVARADGRREAIADVVALLRLWLKRDPDVYLSDAMAGVDALIARYDRLAPPEELPPSACGFPGAVRDQPVLCGLPADHPGQHAWQPLLVLEPSRPWWRRFAVR